MNRYQRRMDLKDVQLALCFTPETEPMYETRLHILADGLYQQYKTPRVRETLLHAITVRRQVLDIPTINESLRCKNSDPPDGGLQDPIHCIERMDATSNSIPVLIPSQPLHHRIRSFRLPILIPQKRPLFSQFQRQLPTATISQDLVPCPLLLFLRLG
jgi:hypothetical protein